ncbi:neuferricin [Dendroctonus ponderosae]
MFKILVFLGFLALLLALHFSGVFDAVTVKTNLFTTSELATFNGVEQPFLYVALLGTVFNVTKGAKHYAKGQQYHVFVGKDASRNFVTGKFKEEDASDDIGGLSNKELKSLSDWMKFYNREYQQIGNLIGRYYDKFGEPTAYLHQMNKRMQESQDEEQSLQIDRQTFPPCNIEWDADRGTRVWCSDKSGGIERKWIGKPRQYYTVGSNIFRCACIHEENEKLGTIKEYPGCDKNSESCYIQTDK